MFRLLNLNLYLLPSFDDLSLIFDSEFFCNLHHNLKHTEAQTDEEQNTQTAGHTPPHTDHRSHTAGGPHVCFWKAQITL